MKILERLRKKDLKFKGSLLNRIWPGLVWAKNSYENSLVYIVPGQAELHSETLPKPHPPPQKKNKQVVRKGEVNGEEGKEGGREWRDGGKVGERRKGMGRGKGQGRGGGRRGGGRAWREGKGGGRRRQRREGGEGGVGDGRWGMKDSSSQW